MPPISVSSSARRSRAIAAGRSSAWAMSFAMSGSYSDGIRSPASTAVSTRIPGPAGITQRVIRPGAGAKRRAGSSAEIRSSMAWLVGRAARSAAAEGPGRQRPAGGQAELLGDDVEAGDELGHGVLHLEPGVHLEEPEAAVAVVEELARGRVAQPGGRPHPDGHRVEAAALGLAEARGRAPPR